MATAFIFNSRLNEGEFFDFVLHDFGIACPSHEKSQRLIRLNEWLVDRFRERRTAVLIVDEAQNLSPDVLEEIRLLTNMETTREKLLQIVLSDSRNSKTSFAFPSCGSCGSASPSGATHAR